MTNYPIVPPPELVEKLQDLGNLDAIALAYRAGADQELEACVALVNDWAQRLGYPHYGAELRAARRPKPPSLKEQALADFDWMVGRTLRRPEFDERSERIRRALEALPE
jgi:hypothetical protein